MFRLNIILEKKSDIERLSVFLHLFLQLIFSEPKEQLIFIAKNDSYWYTLDRSLTCYNMQSSVTDWSGDSMFRLQPSDPFIQDSRNADRNLHLISPVVKSSGELSWSATFRSGSVCWHFIFLTSSVDLWANLKITGHNVLLGALR